MIDLERERKMDAIDFDGNIILRLENFFLRNFWWLYLNLLKIKQIKKKL
jgi:hypothetical protein